MLIKEIQTVQDLIVALEENNDGYNGASWYRGHADEAWSLVPGYYRLDGAPPESTLIKRFKQSAAMLISVTPKDSFDWLFLSKRLINPTLVQQPWI